MAGQTSPIDCSRSLNTIENLTSRLICQYRARSSSQGDKNWTEAAIYTYEDAGKKNDKRKPGPNDAKRPSRTPPANPSSILPRILNPTLGFSLGSAQQGKEGKPEQRPSWKLRALYTAIDPAQRPRHSVAQACCRDAGAYAEELAWAKQKVDSDPTKARANKNKLNGPSQKKKSWEAQPSTSWNGEGILISKVNL